MHISDHSIPDIRVRRTRRAHGLEFRLDLVQRSLTIGASVSALAPKTGINANLLVTWHRPSRPRHHPLASVPIERGTPRLIGRTAIAHATQPRIRLTSAVVEYPSTNGMATDRPPQRAMRRVSSSLAMS